MRSDDAELSEVAPQCVDQHRSLVNEEIPGLVQHQHRLLRFVLHGHKPRGRPDDGLSDRLGVSGVGLAALRIGLHVRRWHEPHLVADRHGLPPLMMGRSARFHADEAGPNRLQEGQYLATPQLPLDDDRAVCGDTVNLENSLRQIEPDHSDGLHDTAPRRDVIADDNPEKLVRWWSSTITSDANNLL